MIETIIWAITTIICTALVSAAVIFYGQNRSSEGHVINIHNDIATVPGIMVGGDEDEEDESEAWRRR